MLKLLKLYWSAMKGCRVKLLLILPTLFGMGWISGSIVLVPLAVYLLFSFSTNSFFVDEKGELNRLYLTLPVSRRRVVAARYLLALLLSAAGIALGLILMPLVNLVSRSKWYPDLRWVLALVLFGFFLHALMSLFIYPVLFWRGYQKGKIWGIYIPVILLAAVFIAVMEYDILIYGGTLVFDLLVYISEHVLTVLGGMFALSILLLAASWALSARIYARKEF